MLTDQLSPGALESCDQLADRLVRSLPVRSQHVADPIEMMGSWIDRHGFLLPCNQGDKLTGTG